MGTASPKRGLNLKRDLSDAKSIRDVQLKKIIRVYENAHLSAQRLLGGYRGKMEATKESDHAMLTNVKGTAI